jgi:hypothetical protein
MKLGKLTIILITSVFMILAFDTAWGKGGNGGNGGGGKVDEGPADPIFTAESLDLELFPVDSHSASSKGQIVFHHALMNLGYFPGTSPSGSCDHGEIDGLLVLQPKYAQGPFIPELLYWFDAALESGDSVTHLLTMEGISDPSISWPPTIDNPVTLQFNYWEFGAENKKAQRQDCAGFDESDGAVWEITVSLQPEPEA